VGAADTPDVDMDAAKSWIYPSTEPSLLQLAHSLLANYPRREYQYSIVQKALFQNTIVSLPTGLGKTFIAAVVMYNFYRWFPEGKVTGFACSG
jgi:Fanconi anemia group M protein